MNSAQKLYIQEEFTRILADLSRLQMKIEGLKNDLKKWIE